MAALQWALTCQRVITDTETNSVSYIDALEAFAVAGFPIPFPPICLSTLWRREGESDRLQARIRVQDPAGKTILSYEPELPQPLPKKRHRLNVILGGADICEAGEFVIIVEQRAGKKWRRETALPLEVTQLVPSPKPARRSRRQGVASR